jgi:hypothetical protein
MSGACPDAKCRHRGADRVPFMNTTGHSGVVATREKDAATRGLVPPRLTVIADRIAGLLAFAEELRPPKNEERMLAIRPQASGHRRCAT